MPSLEEIINGLRLAAAAGQLGITWSDAITLAHLYSDIKADGFDLGAMAQSAGFQGEVAAVGRAATAVSKLLADKDHGPQLIALIATLKKAG